MLLLHLMQVNLKEFLEKPDNKINSRISLCEKFAKKHSITILLKGQE